MNRVELDFYFRHHYTKLGNIRFTEPVAILTTRKLSEVRHIVSRIEKYNEQGYYAAGYISYEAAPAFNRNMRVHNEPKMPLIWFGIFRKPDSIPFEKQEAFNEMLDWQADTDETAYQQAIAYIKKNIEAGNTYQLNHTIRLLADFKGNEAGLFHGLRDAQQADYCAYLKMDDFHVLSASPELFFAKKGSMLEAKPMKGTIKRGCSYDEDQKNKQILRSSEKEQAENVMIVDLLRNDLGRTAVPGSVKVPSLFNVEAYPTVYQMTSTVQAEMESSSRYLDLLEALFPCGSITGAPKLKTMALIEELEPSPREVYCGTIGYFTPEKDAVFNVPIRTAWIDQHSGKATYGVGGGVTWDSTAEGEYAEIAAKGKVLTTQWPSFQLLESLLLEEGEFILLDLHLKRLRRSAEYFGFQLDEELLKEKLSSLSSSRSSGQFKTRVLIGKEGDVAVEASPVTSVKGLMKAAIANNPIDRANCFYYHKTTHRECYEMHRLENPELFDTLLWNEEEELTEFTTGNIVCRLEGSLYTPPISSGLLEGTFREQLIQKGEITEALITKKDLERAEEIWFINSVRGWVPIELH